jgi:small subunit ribosomal protein S16
MPVSIRLSRFGRKDLPFYRVVVVDSRKKRDGEFLETIGTYDGLKTKLVTFKPERYDAWVKLGAQPSDTAKKLYRLFKKEGIASFPATLHEATSGMAEKTVKTESPKKTKSVAKEAAPATKKDSETKEFPVEKAENTLAETAPTEEPKE